MISKASIIIVNLLIKHSAIREEDQDLYQYGFFILISQVLYFTITIVFGLIFHVFIESIVLYFSFQLIRRYAGGLHASTEILCGILTTLLLFICVIVIKIFLSINSEIPLLVVALLSVISICFFCPLDTTEKPLTDKEYHYYRKKTWFITLIISVLILISLIFELNILFVPSCLSLILESVLLIGGKVKKVYQLKNVEK